MATKLRIHRPETGEVSAGMNLDKVLGILHRSFQCAHELNCNVWDFAIELRVFDRAAVETTDIRWLVAKGYAEHGLEQTQPGARHRRFRRGRHLTFTEKSCFVLTDRGVAFAQRVLHWTARQTGPQLRGATTEPERKRGHIPKWDSNRRELSYAGIVIKRFKEPARNQETILAAFEEEKWKRHIDDPLPPRTGSDSKKRLHDAIHSLNQNQLRPALRFHGDGTGRRVYWEAIPQASTELRQSFDSASPERR